MACPLDEPEVDAQAGTVDVAPEYVEDRNTLRTREYMLRELDQDHALRYFKSLITLVAAERKEQGLPTTTRRSEVAYGREHTALRKVCYGPILEVRHGRKLLYELLTNQPSGETLMIATAALILADDPTVEGLQVLLKGFRATPSDLTLLISVGRHLGRACGYLVDHPEATETVAEVIAEFEQRVAEGSSWERGVGLEGLYRIGFHEKVHAELQRVLTSEEAPRDVMRTVNWGSRLFTMTEDAAQLRAMARNYAREQAEAVLSRVTDTRSHVQRVSTDARLLTQAIGFLEDGGTSADVPFLMDCYQDSRVPMLLGITGLQGLRLSLQHMRSELSEELRYQLDSLFFERLIQACERLFFLEEEPMDEEERSEFAAARDLRYNAAYYFISLWDQGEDVQGWFTNHPDVVDFFSGLARATHDESEGEAGDRLFYRVREKLETRVLLSRLLAKLEYEHGRSIPFDLGQHFLELTCTEVQAPYEDLREAFDRLVEHQNPYLLFEMPQLKPPADNFVRDEALLGLSDLGYEVFLTTKRFEVRLPWPHKEAEEAEATSN
jgi:hypothetical protein